MRILIFAILIILPFYLQGQTEKQERRAEKVQQRKEDKAELKRFDSKRFRDATAAGPYPLYFTAAYVSSGSFDDFERLNQVLDASSTSFNDWKHNMRGFDATFGGIINGFVQNLIVEGGYTRIWRSLNDDVQEVSSRYEFGSFRVGYRVNKIGNFQIPYPLTLKISAGPVLYSRRVFQFESLGATDPSVSKISFEVKKNKIAYNGVDVHIRIDILDPVNTSGGLGVFFEYRKLFLSDRNQVNLAPVFDRLGNPAEYQSDRHASNIAIGITIPLALRF